MAYTGFPLNFRIWVLLELLFSIKFPFNILKSSRNFLEETMWDHGPSYVTIIITTELLKSSDFFQKIPTALQINLYCDDWVPVNKLGQRKGNIPKKYRNRLKDIHLLILIKSEFTSLYGYTRIVKSLETEGDHHELWKYTFFIRTRKCRPRIGCS